MKMREVCIIKNKQNKSQDILNMTGIAFQYLDKEIITYNSLKVRL